MFCIKCGKEIGDDFNVCPYCGTATNNGTRNGNHSQQINYQKTANNSSQSNSNNSERLKPDEKYNFIAGFFTLFWALFKGMWDLVLVCFAFMIIGLIPVIGQVISLTWFAVSLIVIGRTANYYYRLKKTQNIWMYQAIMNPELRRL